MKKNADRFRFESYEQIKADGLRVGVNRGYTYHPAFLEAKLGSQEFSSAKEGLEALIAGEIDLYPMDRTVGLGLLPVDIGELGLRAGLESLVSRAGKLFGIECVLEPDGEQEIWDPEVGMHLFYAAQEAIANAVRHGKAKRVILRLRANAYRGYLAIEDNGRGLSLRSGRGDDGAGFRTMRFRAEACDGWFKIVDSQPAGITVILGFKNRRVEVEEGET